MGRLMHLLELDDRHPRVDLRRAQVGVPEQRLDEAHMAWRLSNSARLTIFKSMNINPKLRFFVEMGVSWSEGRYIKALTRLSFRYRDQ